MLTGGIRHAAQKMVIKCLRPVAGRVGVEHIARNQQHVDLLLLNRCYQPVQKSGKFFIAVLVTEGAP